MFVYRLISFRASNEWIKFIEIIGLCKIENKSLEKYSEILKTSFSN